MVKWIKGEGGELVNSDKVMVLDVNCDGNVVAHLVYNSPFSDYIILDTKYDLDTLENWLIDDYQGTYDRFIEEAGI